jgi:hypothetical protein
MQLRCIKICYAPIKNQIQMKNNQNILTKIVVCIILFMGIMAFNTQDSKLDTIMIRSTQIAVGGGNKSFIRVYKGNGEIERIQLEKWKLDEEEKNYDKIISAVRKYEEMGYQTISSSEVMFGVNGFVNTFILTKK